MYEIEVRARLLSKEEYAELEEKLAALAEDLGKRRLRDRVYGPKGLYSVKETGFCYRIREYDDELVVDRKGQIPSAWKEEKLSFLDKETAHTYLTSRGLLPYLIIDRIRHEYKKGDVMIALDDVRHLGCFIEVEERVADPNLAESVKPRLIEFLTGLGVSEDKIELAPYGWLLTLELERNRPLAEQMAKELGISVDQLFGRQQ